MMRERIGQTGVYRLYDAADRLLYVGVGAVPESRWADHAKSKDWWQYVARKAVVWHPTMADALAEEARAIETESPFYNIRRGAKVPEPPAASDYQRVPLQVARANLGDRVNAAHFGGEITVITKSGEERAAIIPLALLRKLTA